MSFAAISNTVAQTTNAQFQAWVAEIVTALFTTIGVTQTADTGQINPATVTIPGGVNTSAGYVIGRFNDALQSTAPIFFKLEFGTGGVATTIPGMWFTVGTGSNGSGTITNGGGGAVTTRCAITNGSTALSSTSTAFTSRYCYVGTSACGVLHMEWKYGGVSLAATSSTIGGFVIARSNDGNGNATGTGVLVLTTALSAGFTGNAATNGYAQVISFSLGALVSAAPANGWEGLDRTSNVYGLASLVESSTSFVIPAYVLDPVLRYSAYVGSCMLGDFAFGTTSSFAVVGASPITYISAGFMFGATNAYNGGGASKGLVLPWQ